MQWWLMTLENVHIKYIILLSLVYVKIFLYDGFKKQIDDLHHEKTIR